MLRVEAEVCTGLEVIEGIGERSAEDWSLNTFHFSSIHPCGPFITITFLPRPITTTKSNLDIPFSATAPKPVCILDRKSVV